MKNRKVKLTRPQRTALYRAWLRLRPENNHGTYVAWRRALRPDMVIDSYKAVLLPWCGMILGIEADGYAHT